jgi:hypothetical protein
MPTNWIFERINLLADFENGDDEREHTSNKIVGLALR